MTSLATSPRRPRRAPARISVGALAGVLLSITFAPAAHASSPVASFSRSAGPPGAAQVLIVVNGGPGVDSQHMFRGFKALASPSRRVVAYDQRGVGRTPAPRSLDYTLDAFVADLEALRLSLCRDQIDLLGHSFGALIAAAYTAVHPDRVRSLTLVSGLPMSLTAQYEGDARFETRVAALQRRGVVPKVVPEPCALRSRALLPAYVGDPTRARMIGALLGPLRCDDGTGVLANQAIASDPRRSTLERALAGYRGRALVVIGARDPFGTVWADDAARPLRNARLTKHVLPHAGHFPWLETPAFMPLFRAVLEDT